MATAKKADLKVKSTNFTGDDGKLIYLRAHHDHIDGKPTSYPPTTHNHTVDEIEGLQDILSQYSVWEFTGGRLYVRAGEGIADLDAPYNTISGSHVFATDIEAEANEPSGNGKSALVTGFKWVSSSISEYNSTQGKIDRTAGFGRIPTEAEVNHLMLPTYDLWDYGQSFLVLKINDTVGGVSYWKLTRVDTTFQGNPKVYESVFASAARPTWNQVANKPTFATVALSGSYADLSNKPSIPGIPIVMTTTEGNTGTASTQRTINAKNLKDIILNHSPAGSRPASDVSAWAKASTKPSYNKSDVGLGNVDNTSDLNKPISTATQTALNSKANDSDVVKLSGIQTIKGDKTFEGDTVITGDLTVSGTNFIAETTTVRTDDDLIELRSNGTTSIATPAGIAIRKYDGTNDGGIVIKNDGEVRVGKITIGTDGKISNSASNAQPVLTRAEKNNLTNNGLLVWESTNNRAVTKALSDLGIANDSVVVKLSGAQSIAGVKTFTSIPLLPASTPTSNNQAVRKAYVDDKINTISLTPGPEGPEGPEGPPGQAATVSVGTTSTSASGGNASVTQRGDAQARIFDFVIPRGEQGEKGEKGTASLNSIDVRGDDTPGSQWDLIPADMDNRSITSYFSQFPSADGMGTSWKSLLNIKGWSGSTYASWQLIGPASTSGTDEGLFYRTGNSTSGWSTPRRIYHGGNLSNLRTDLGTATTSVNGLMSSADKTKLNGIASGAEVNVQSDWNITDTANDGFIKNKPTIPTKVSALTNDTGFITGYTETDPIFTAWNKSTGISITKSQVTDLIEATQSLSGLMSATDKTRLDVLHALLEEDTANNVVDSINEVLAIFNNYPEGADLVTALAGKVDKVNGKGLSTNDFTTALKDKLDGIEVDTDGNIGQVVRATTEDKNILGTTQEVFNISEKKVWFNKGALFFGTALDAGLVTRGISGTNATGSIKDHLYINYDGNNTLSRQLVLGAGSIGTDRGNGIYDYSAVRGDAFISYLTNTLGSYAKTSALFSKNYNDLTNKPSIPAAQVQSNWNATTGMGAILNKPALKAVATSGSYNDLTNKPTIPSAYVLTKTGIDTALAGTGSNSIQLGADTSASGESSTALGYYTSASGIQSTALGYNTTAEGITSTALGANASAGGNSSTALGYYTIASNSGSTAVGRGATASGVGSTAVGLGATANGENSIAIGKDTEVTEDNVVDFGSSRQVRVNETPVNDRDATSKKYVDDYIGDLTIPVSERIDDVEDGFNSRIDNVESGKQDKLVAGDNITINPVTNVISANITPSGTWKEVYSGPSGVVSKTSYNILTLNETAIYYNRPMMMEIRFGNNSITYTHQIVTFNLGSDTATTPSKIRPRVVSITEFDGQYSKTTSVKVYVATGSTNSLNVGQVKTLIGDFTGTPGTLTWTTQDSLSVYIGKIWVMV